MNERKELLSYSAERLPESPICIELGVATGDHSELIDNCLKPKKLYLLDAWGSNEKYNERIIECNPDIDFDRPYEWIKESSLKNYESVKIKFENRDHIEVIQQQTNTGHLGFEDNFFDFIYIDADHRYEAVKEDLNNWFPKLKEGGIFSGHDYCHHRDVEVIKAVDEFREQKKEQVKGFRTFGTGLSTCWLMEKV